MALFSDQSVTSQLPRVNPDELDDELEGAGFASSRFVTPDFNARLVPQTWLAKVPVNATVKGMYMDNLATGARKYKVPCADRYVAFKDYPLQGFMDLTVRCAQMRYPHVPLREGIRRIGWEAFPTLMGTITGRVIFATAGRDIQAVLKLAPVGYRHSISPGSVDLLYAGPRQVLLGFRNIFNFVDCFQVGVVEGAAHIYDKSAQVTIDSKSDSDMDLLVRW